MPIHNGMKRVYLLLFCTLLTGIAQHRLFALSFVGPDYAIYSSRPDQNSSVIGPGENDYRDAFVNRISSLGAGDIGYINGFTFSGGTQGAGGILTAIETALQNGATIRMTMDSVNAANFATITNSFGNSVNSLLTAYPTLFSLETVTTTASQIHHNKFFAWDRRTSTSDPTQAGVFTGSANFTAGAHTFQWNAAVEIRSVALYDRYRLEAMQLHGTPTVNGDGLWHNNPLKNKTYDLPPNVPGISFDSGNGTVWVMFSPTDDTTTPGGDNPASYIASSIASATSSVVLALNKLGNFSSNLLPQAIVTAANNGAEVHLVLPQSDIASFSLPAWNYLNNPANYANAAAFARMNFYLADEIAGGPLDPDTGAISDLVHTKFAVIDGYRTITGSANWTAAATRDTNQNDENTLFIDHSPIAYHHLRIFADIVNTQAVLNLSDTQFADYIISLIPEPHYYTAIVMGTLLFAVILLRSNRFKSRT